MQQHFWVIKVPTYLFNSPYLDFENLPLGVLMKWHAAMPSGSKPLPASQECQKRNAGIGDCSKSAEKESKRGSKSQHQTSDSGNLPNTLSATPKAEVSHDAEACVSQGAAMNQGEWKKCEGRGKKLNPEKVSAGQASIFDISNSESETA